MTPLIIQQAPSSGRVKALGGHAATAKIAEVMPDIDVYACAKYILKEGTQEEKRDLLTHLRSELTITAGIIQTGTKFKNFWHVM